MQSKLPRRDIVLLGVGHTNAHILKMWRMSPIPDARLTCISNHGIATYSGMMPGVLATQYKPSEMEIDLERLCVANNAHLIVDEVTGIDREERLISFADRAEIRYDYLSIGIGSVAQANGIDTTNPRLVPIKPMQDFLRRLEDAITSHCAKEMTITIVGGGVGGVEVAFGLLQQRSRFTEVNRLNVQLVNSGKRLASSVTDRTEKSIRSELERSGVSVILGRRVNEITGNVLVLDDEGTIETDITIWATSAIAPPLLEKLPFKKDDRGFLLTRNTLQTLDDDRVFAVGDTGTLKETPTVKAGVYAVRQGPYLWNNLIHAMRKEPMEAYRPQPDFMKLINLGDGRAIAEYKGMTFKGKWCWRLKDRIDRKFMAMYQNYTPMMMGAADEAVEPLDMRCTGCGGKVGGSVLSQALHRLNIQTNESVLLGLDRPDDAAVIQTPDGKPFSWTVDFFTSPLSDPYHSGRLAALNSLSDIFAMGDQPLAALAVIMIPVGVPRQQQQLLYELLSGAVHEFDKCNTALVGGHTIEGPQIAVGFSIVGKEVARIDNARISDGDKLVLTKRLGSGVMLAAHMQAQCKANWLENMREVMFQSNAVALSLLEQHQVSALTDVTGFGFAGHLLELLRGTDMAVDLNLEAIPLYEGFESLSKLGVESTLAPANRDAEQWIRVAEPKRSLARYAALFDPQTCGGLMFSAAPETADDLVQFLHSEGHTDACVVGAFRPKQDDGVLIQVS